MHIKKVMQKAAKLNKEIKEMKKRLPPKGGNIKVIAGILAATMANDTSTDLNI